MADMRKLIRKQTNLARTYADDGAYHSAASILSELAQTIKLHAERIDRELEKMMGGTTT